MMTIINNLRRGKKQRKKGKLNKMNKIQRFWCRFRVQAKNAELFLLKEETVMKMIEVG